MKRSSLTISFLLLTTALVRAESEAEKVFQTIVDDINKSGIATMDVGSTHYNADTDTLTAQNVVFKSSFKLPDLENGSTESDADDSMRMQFEFTMSAMISQGLAPEDGGYSYQSIKYENLNGKIDVDLPEKGTVVANTTVSWDGPAEVQNGYSPFLGEFKVAPSRPIGSIMDYVRPLLMKSRFESYSSAPAKIESSLADGTVLETQELGPTQITDFSDGKIASYEIDYQKGMRPLRAQLKADMAKNGNEKAPDLDNVPENITYEVGKTIYEGYDFGALWSAIDPNAKPLEADQTVLEESSVRDITIKADDIFTATMGSGLIKGLKIKNSISDLVPELDKLVAEGKKPEDLPQAQQEELIKTALNFIRGWSLDLTNIRDIQGTVTIPEGPFKGQVANFAADRYEILDVSSDGIKEIAATGLSYDGPPTIKVALDRFAIEKVEFPSYELLEKTIKVSTAGGKPSPSESAKLMPNSMNIVVAGLAFEDAQTNKLSTDEIRVEMNRKGLAVPAYLSTKIDDLVVSKSLIQHPIAGVLMQQLGLNELTVNEEITLNWDADTETYKLEPLNIELGSIAELTGALGFGGIKRQYLDNPEMAQAAMATGTILPSTLTLKDRGGINELINLAGGMTGMGPDQVRTFAEGQVQAMLSAFTKPDFARMVAGQVQAFLSDPKSLHIALNPGAPVPIAQILGAAGTAPDTIPEILSIGVMANEH